MKMPAIYRLSLVCLFAGSAAACATNHARFEWGRYDTALYVYSKKPDQRPAYKQALEEAVARGRAKNNVAPGLLAELGYLYMEDGDTAQAVTLFTEEEKRFPESRAFMDRMIARAQGAATSAKKEG